MNPLFKKSAALVALAVALTGCASAPASTPEATTPATPEVTTPDTTQTPAADAITWKTYENPQFGFFTMQYPEQVMLSQSDSPTLRPLNVFEEIGEMPITKGSVYFTTRSLEDTVKDKLWDLRVGVLDSDTKDQVVPFLEEFYGVKGCAVEYNDNPENGYKSVTISAKDTTLQPDDPNSCFVGGKVVTAYDEATGKLITYKIVEPFFYEADGNVSEQALASLKFEPTK